jgi:hypothetical protein
MDGAFPSPPVYGARGGDPSSPASDATAPSANRRSWRGWVRTHAELQRALCLSSIASLPLTQCGVIGMPVPFVSDLSAALTDTALCEALFELAIAPSLAGLSPSSTAAYPGHDSIPDPIADAASGSTTWSSASAFVLGAMLPLVVVPMTRVRGLRSAALAVAVAARFPPPAIEALACAVCESVRVGLAMRIHTSRTDREAYCIAIIFTLRVWIL